MRDRDDLACSVTVAGLAHKSMGEMHFDRVGTWGGKRAVVVHVGPEQHHTLLMYMLVGSYEKVGKWRLDPGPSRWQVAKLLTWALQTGVDTGSLYDAITCVIARAGDDDALSELPEEGTWVDGPDRGWGLFVHHKCTGCNMPFRVWEVEPDRRCPRCGRQASE